MKTGAFLRELALHCMRVFLLGLSIGGTIVWMAAR